ncbi:MAG: DNA gyrase inhibitor YacG [Alphaproteobacteria bacterium]|nr:DNA gyrase inhibitor YacG [Alphaproteobacteria bacterium]
MSPQNDKAKACPICGRDSVAKYQPFCSARCADLDLGRWLRGSYSIPSDEPIAEDESEDSPGQLPHGGRGPRPV